MKEKSGFSGTVFVTTQEDRVRFAKLPYPKVLFVGEVPKEAFEVYTPEIDQGMDLTAYGDIWGRRHFEKRLDCVRFLNESLQEKR